MIGKDKFIIVLEDIGPNFNGIFELGPISDEMAASGKFDLEDEKKFFETMISKYYGYAVPVEWSVRLVANTKKLKIGDTKPDWSRKCYPILMTLSE